MNQRTIQRLLAPLRRRMDMLITRAVVRGVDSSLGRQVIRVSLLEGESAVDVEHAEPYGFTSQPHPGAGLLGLFVGGRRSHGVAIGMGDKRYRLKNLEPGEVALYTDEGDQIVLKRGRRIEVIGGNEVSVETEQADVQAGTSANVTAPQVTVSASTGVTIDTPAAAFTGDVTAEGIITGQTDVFAGTVSGKNHTHPENDNGGPTGPPQ